MKRFFPIPERLRGQYDFPASVYQIKCPRCGSPAMHWCSTTSGTQLSASNAHSERTTQPKLKRGRYAAAALLLWLIHPTYAQTVPLTITFGDCPNDGVSILATVGVPFSCTLGVTGGYSSPQTPANVKATVN
jgi:hypothetical protein